MNGHSLPLPPVSLRELVGPIRDEFYDNPTGQLLYADLPIEAYRSVLDFGCGCGRLARQLIQQTTQPTSYVGVDIHRGMIRWCQENLTPAASQFQFYHHDVYNPSLNPATLTRYTSFPVSSRSVSLAIAHSVFTHIMEDQVPQYLQEMARVLDTDGVLVSTWFLFDKREFPMLNPNQNCLYVNLSDPTNALIYDKGWVSEAATRAGLVLTYTQKPAIRGFQWVLHFRRLDAGHTAVAFPPDDAPVGTVTV